MLKDTGNIKAVGPLSPSVLDSVKVKKHIKEDNSYANDFSNVSKLEKYLLVPNDPDKKVNDFDAHFKIYTSGIGTEDLESESLTSFQGIGNKIGQGTGRFGTGVKGKVEKAIGQIVQEVVGYVQDYASKEDIVDKIQIDSVGFSRGAAAARHFVYMAIQDPKWNLKTKLAGIVKSVGEIKSGFVGLFDTVASVVGGGGLQLSAIAATEKVVHLVAADEYRKHFPVTNIKSKGSTEIYLPGVHSDIGGGYPDNCSEDELEIFDIDAAWTGKAEKDRLAAERNWLINEQGWYTDEQVSKPNFWNEITVSRPNIRNTYSRIPLHILKNQMAGTTLNFDDADINGNDEMPASGKEHDELNLLYSKIGNDGSGSWKQETELLKKIRNKYFHFSSYYTLLGINDPRMVGGKRKRDIIDG
jgi:uncharacterized protein YjbJ (UPF0337 family)